MPALGELLAQQEHLAQLRASQVAVADGNANHRDFGARLGLCETHVITLTNPAQPLPTTVSRELTRCILQIYVACAELPETGFLCNRMHCNTAR